MARKRSQQKAEFKRRAREARDEMRCIGEGFGDHVERRFGRWYYSPWSAVFSFVLGILGLAFAIWVLGWTYAQTGIQVLGALGRFFYENFAAFVLLTALSSLIEFVSRANRTANRLLWPVSFGMACAVIAWIFSSLVLEGEVFASNADVWDLAVLVNSHLLGVFALFALIGYFGVLLGVAVCRRRGRCIERGGHMAMKEKSGRPASSTASPIKGKRLYRSGNEKILGGVCGGIAEYLGIDPTIVRLVWVLLSLAWGAGIVLYIIMWIITPRNPNHRWAKS
ncbi:MAG: PspC domain-containing protein [Candidatus Micrarchaeota archaeon]